MLTSEKQKNYNLKYPKGGFSYYTLFRGIYDPENGIDERPVDAETGDRFEPQNSSEVYIATRKNGKTKWAIDENASRQTETGEGGSGGGGVSSWNDLTDKPFYEEIVPAINITNPDYATVTEDATGMFIVEGQTIPMKLYRVGAALSAEVLNGATFGFTQEIGGESESETETIDPEDIIESADTNENIIGRICVGNFPAILVADVPNATLEYDFDGLQVSATLPTPGTYFVWVSQNIEGQELLAYTTKLQKAAGTVVHKLDQKFLPDSGGAGGLVVNMTLDAQTGVVTGDKTFRQVFNTMKTAGNVILYIDYGNESFDVYKVLSCIIINGSVDIFILAGENIQKVSGAENDYIST